MLGSDNVTLKDFFTTATTSGTTYSALSIVLGDSQEDIDKEGIYTLKTNDKFHSNVYANAFPSNNIQIIGSDKIDWVMANSSNKKFDIDVEGGNDHVFGSDMNDIIKGGAGNDLIYGSPGFYDFADENNPKLPKPQKEGEGADEDTLIGGLGNDLISGGFGNDTIWAEDEYKGDGKTPLHEDPSWARYGLGKREGDLEWGIVSQPSHKFDMDLSGRIGFAPLVCGGGEM